MDEEREQDRSGAYHWDSLLDESVEPPPDEFTNPPGVARGACDTEEAEKDESCELESTATVDDLVLGETKPGYGIPGFEGEEDGGG